MFDHHRLARAGFVRSNLPALGSSQAWYERTHRYTGRLRRSRRRLEQPGQFLRHLRGFRVDERVEQQPIHAGGHAHVTASAFRANPAACTGAARVRWAARAAARFDGEAPAPPAGWPPRLCASPPNRAGRSPRSNPRFLPGIHRKPRRAQRRERLLAGFVHFGQHVETAPAPASAVRCSMSAGSSRWLARPAGAR